MLWLDLRLERDRFRMEMRTEIEDGATGLFGSSGAGKSTLLHLVAGLARPDAGRIVLDGDVLCDTKQGIWVPPHRRRIGLVFQDGRLFPHLTVAGNLRYASRLAPRGAKAPPAAEVLDLLEIGGLMDRPVAGLSGGERQRVALARALLGAPRLLLLDEPLASLDRPRRERIMPLLRRVVERIGVPTILVSHDLEEVLRLADRLVVLDGGRLLGRGSPEIVMREPAAGRLLRESEFVNVFTARVSGHEPDDGVTCMTLETAGPEGFAVVRGPLMDHPEGARVQAVLPPRDVALAGEALAGFSIQNQLPGRVTAVDAAGATVMVQVDVGARLVAEVTPRAARDLGLRPGAPVLCLFKAHALRMHRL